MDVPFWHPTVLTMGEMGPKMNNEKKSQKQNKQTKATRHKSEIIKRDHSGG